MAPPFPTLDTQLALAQVHVPPFECHHFSAPEPCVSRKQHQQMNLQYMSDRVLDDRTETRVTDGSSSDPALPACRSRQGFTQNIGCTLMDELTAGLPVPSQQAVYTVLF